MIEACRKVEQDWTEHRINFYSGRGGGDPDRGMYKGRTRLHRASDKLLFSEERG